MSSPAPEQCSVRGADPA